MIQVYRQHFTVGNDFALYVLHLIYINIANMLYIIYLSMSFCVSTVCKLPINLKSEPVNFVREAVRVLVMRSLWVVVVGLTRDSLPHKKAI